MLICKHCGEEIAAFPRDGGDTHWAHQLGPAESPSYLNRCQDPTVQYGMEAHPVDTPCPTWCLGSRMGQM